MYKLCTEGATNNQFAHHRKQKSLELRGGVRTFRRGADKAHHKSAEICTRPTGCSAV